MNQRFLGSKELPILEKIRKGKGHYWIISRQNIDYLVPKRNIKINEYNYKTVEALFSCKNFQPGTSSDFKLTKPAKVSRVSPEIRQLVESGIIQF